MKKQYPRRVAVVESNDHFINGGLMQNAISELSYGSYGRRDLQWEGNTLFQEHKNNL